MYFDDLLLIASALKIAMFYWRINHFIIIQCPSLSLITFLALDSALTEINMVVLCYFSCVQLCNAMHCSFPGSSVHGRSLQAKILEWVVMHFSRASSQHKDQIHTTLCLLHWQMSSLPLALPGKPNIAISAYFC